MSMRYLGASFDLHTGGIDLVFPHHEDEIAQSEAATGQPFVAHVDALRAPAHARREDGQAVGQLRTTSRRLRRPASLRGPCASRCWRRTTAHRSSSVMRRWHTPAAAVERLVTAVTALEAYAADGPTTRPSRSCSLTAGPTSRPVSRMISTSRRHLRRSSSSSASSTAGSLLAHSRVPTQRRAASRLRELDNVLGVLDDDTPELPPELATLLEARAAARAQRDWARSDTLRDELGAPGVDRRGHARRPTLAQDLGAMTRNDDDRGGTGPGKSQGTSGGGRSGLAQPTTSRPDPDRAPRSRGAGADGRGGKQPGAGSGHAGERPQASDGRPPDGRGRAVPIHHVTVPTGRRTLAGRKRMGPSRRGSDDIRTCR